MATHSSPGDPRAIRVNRLLAALPSSVLAELQPLLEPVQLPGGRILYEPGAPITAVYFPLTAVVSMLRLLGEGTLVEVAMIGNEGMAGLPLVLGLEADTNQALVQVPGDALRLPAAAFVAVLTRHVAFRDLLQRSLQVVMVQMSQAAACNRLHPVDERCARWLLETHDRAGSDSFPLTQEFLAAMLGVRRPSVTIAAGMLQQAGLIRYHRGRITIVDREALESASCECYATITHEADRLLGAQA